MLQPHIIKAVFYRNVASFFSGILGYLFIVVFVVAASFAAFSPQFFTNNLANLDQLTFWFPLLLLFIVPAITMGTWADERRSGTDELLFTLPASDVDILLGKYLAVVCIYTFALIFSVSNLFVLAWIGDPDWGLIFTTYLGYWIAGAALLSIGMFASVLTNSTFVLGTVLCSVPVLIGQAAPWSDFLKSLSLSEQLHDFTTGVIPLSGILYFASLAVFMQYLNLVFITKRHWSAAQKMGMGWQYLIRAIACGVTLVSINNMASHASMRIDMTAEKIFSLSDTTRNLIGKIEAERPVLVQAFVSPDVPRQYVPVQKRLLGLLRQYNDLGGSRISIRIVNVEPYSPEAEEADLLGIPSRKVYSEVGGRSREEDIFLGATVSSAYGEVVIPFFDLATPIEYELTRSIRTVSKEDRLTIGVLATDANVTGGFDMSSFRSLPEWQITDELKKQYKVEQVSADAAIDTGKYQVLLAVMPSSLTEPQMQNFINYVRSGKPVLIFDDPLPISSSRGLQLAPRSPKPSAGGGGMFGQQAPPEPKADGGKLTRLLNLLEIAWDNGQVAWDNSGQRIHPEFGDMLREEILFISPANGTKSALNNDSEITNGLQEIVSFFAGTVRPRANSTLKFEPLLRTSADSGLIDWDDIVSPGMFGGVSISPDPPLFIDKDAHVIAAHITGKLSGDAPGPDGAAPPETSLNVIFVSDADIISDQMFELRQRGFRRTESSAELNFDNVTFVLNAVDVLAGDDSYITLRNRRTSHRTLMRVESYTSNSLKEQNEQNEAATKEAKEKIEQAKENFRKEREKIEKDTSIDDRTKSILLRMKAEEEERKLQVAQANIERDKQAELDRIKAKTVQEIRQIEDTIRYASVAIPPIPAVLLGLIMLLARWKSEQSNISPERRVKST
ncbi:MAG: Gldg family protein [Planctomycetota bacterium]|nr:Gldg family protein [Planctomycetota bacterium]